MIPLRILAPSLIAFAFVSCAAQKTDTTETANPYGAADGGAVNPPANAPANPVYDTPAAYEESGTTTAPATATAAAPAVNTPPTPARPNTPAAATPRPSSNGAAIIHTVVAGDTLSGISAKYKVPAAAIRQANGMTKDTVVLGRKMVIPPVQ